MDATVIAVNHALGAIAVELENKTCVVLETSSQFFLDIGDTVTADWQSEDTILVKNVNKDSEFDAHVQKTTETRGDAISSISII
ncbi:MAG: hypothetical protein COB46_03280 [Rhodospirillaceae bacterium]|nr:MAG: hypothetical protein COB46_03280 [Rhodospirillaceae bacterium]